MPIITGKNGKLHKITNIHTGGHDIAKVYLGSQLVFEKDSAMWLIKGYSVLRSSKNGTTFNLSQTSNIDIHWLPPVYCTKYFVLANTNNSRLFFYNTKLLRNNNLSYITKNLPSGYDELISLSSNGKDVLVISSKYSTKLTYSLDKGDNWDTVDTGVGGYFSNYIGDNEFFIYPVYVNSSYPVVRQNLRDGYYLYWDSDDPTSLKWRRYKLPNDEYLPYQGNGRAVDSVQQCNNGVVYTSIYIYTSGQVDREQSGLYYGTKEQATGKVVVYDFRGEELEGYGQLTNITYYNNKYYAIEGNPTKRSRDYGPQDPGFKLNLTKSLFVSDDGIVFNEILNYFPDYVQQIEKNAGQLQVYGRGFFGYIDKSDILRVTRFDDKQGEYASRWIDYVGGMACNKFHEM